ncbi:hypothetical protein [Streptomyces sp. NPDC056672]|uniref:hypothetical protein n=1 Tax=Streptomyces sp. NPDC056672 TaxID=3345906 RepID=UPI0036C10845
MTRTRYNLSALSMERNDVAETTCGQVRTVEFHLPGACREFGISGRREPATALSAVAS